MNLIGKLIRQFRKTTLPAQHLVAHVRAHQHRMRKEEPPLLKAGYCEACRQPVRRRTWEDIEVTRCRACGAYIMLDPIRTGFEVVLLTSEEQQWLEALPTDERQQQLVDCLQRRYERRYQLADLPVGSWILVDVMNAPVVAQVTRVVDQGLEAVWEKCTLFLRYRYFGTDSWQYVGFDNASAEALKVKAAAAAVDLSKLKV